MADKMTRDEARQKVWKELRNYAYPDSRFSWDFAEFIADYKGSDACADQIRNHEVYRNSRVIFITPDNNLQKLREYAILDNKVMVMTNYGITRGFFLLRPGAVPEGKAELAATLDGFEAFNEAVSLKALKEEFGSVDMLVTGASAITIAGFRFGKGHGFFDLEWAMFWETGLVSQDSPVFAVGHDCQVVDVDISPSPYDTVVDYIVTPSYLKKITSDFPKPTHGVIWEKLEEGMIDRIPPLQELRESSLN